MSRPPRAPPAARPPPWATAVVIPTLWTPEQALAVFELLDDLREHIWALHGSQIQDLLRHQQSHADAGVHPDGDTATDQPF